MSDEDDYEEDDVDFFVDFEKQAATKEEIKSRVDQYLTASKLGRLAFLAGDVQLAKDRFNLAMSLEMQTEFENNVDFGVTGGLLRDEMLTRCGKSLDGVKRFGNILPRLLQVFEYADTMIGKRSKDPQWYVVMGASLCLVNEWDKAEVVYKEGLKACPGNKDILKSLHSLQKVNETIQESFSKAGVKVSPTWNHDESDGLINHASSNSSSSIAGLVDEPKFRPIYKIDKKRLLSLPGESSSSSGSSSSLLTFQSLPRKLSGTVQVPKEVKRFRSKSLASKHSMKRFSLSQRWNEHSVWKASFSPLIQSEKLDEGFSSRTLQTMRTINSLSDIDITIFDVT